MAATPPIDYTNLGYEALREAMLSLARERVPEWTDQSASDLGVLLVDLFAYACDVTLYYQTRIAANLLPETSDEPDALVQLLRLIGYEVRPPAAATANLRLSFDAAVPTPIAIPAGTQFFARLAGGQEVAFETERDHSISLAQLTPADAAGRRHFFPLPVVEGRTVTGEVVGASDGSPNQMFPLTQSPVLSGSIRVSVAEPGGTTRWQVVESLAGSSPADRHCVVQRDASGRAVLLFGGQHGLAPPAGTAIAPANVSVTYRVGGGVRGNLPAGTPFRPSLALVRAASSPLGSGGGDDAESIERARSLAPRLFRSQERAVTADDYRDHALQVPGVGKAMAVSVGWNHVVLFVAPSGRVAEPSELLKRDLLDSLERRRMVTTGLRIVGPRPADVYVAATVTAQPFFLRADVQREVEKAVAAHLAFDSVDFGKPVYLSRIYDAIQSLPQVASVNVTEFGRAPGAGIATDGTISLAPDEVARPGYPAAIAATVVGGVA